MKDEPKSFLSNPLAILLGSIIIAVSILLHGGIIQIEGRTPTGGNAAANPGTTTGTVQPAAGGGAAQKSEADVINALKAQAQGLKLDTNKFNSCLDNGTKAEAVKKDLTDGTSLGVNGTPAFFINGRLVPGAVPFDQFKTIIEEEISNPPTLSDRKTVSVGDLPVLGNANAPVTIIEFSDYECPFCERFYTQTEKQLKTEYVDTGKVKIYYRDFPLSQIHPGAQKAAEAARCAGDQNKYWEYHDTIFENQSSIF